MEIRPFKVSEINQYIKRIFTGDLLLYDINIEGEVSNFKYHYNGNMYFTLKDDKSKLRCVYFNNNINDYVVLEDGMNVIVNGYISVYERDGVYQLYVRNIRKKGTGELFEAFEKLKKKLEAEGLFDLKYKKSIKFLPRRIGVATSSSGAAVKDIISVIKRRMPSTDIIIYPVLVQGEKAPDDICKAIKYFNSRKDIDLIIIGRGGGSIEELWAFNDEQLARTIFNSKLPVVSAVGHETDFTIADFVSDMRAPTPSAAGELVVPNVADLNYKLDLCLTSLISAFNQFMNKKKDELEHICSKLMTNSPTSIIDNNKQRLDMALKDLIKTINLNYNNKRSKLEYLGSKLDTLSPFAVLNRGYSMIVDENGNLIKSVENILINSTLNVILNDGKIKVKVLDKSR